MHCKHHRRVGATRAARLSLPVLFVRGWDWASGESSSLKPPVAANRTDNDKQLGNSGSGIGLISCLTPFVALGLDSADRQLAYRELFRYELEPGLVDEIRRATNGNYALGNERFAIEIAAALGRRSVPGQSGRPRWMRELETGELFNE